VDVTEWDERYAAPEYAYGTEPNDYLRAVACQIPRGRVLCLAEGQGRNAVFLAGQGHDVVAVDQSPVGLGRARELADAAGVSVTCVTADLAEYTIEREAFDGIVAISMHLPPALRHRVYRGAVEGLRPGGVVILEAYTPRQIGRGTGGPPVEELLVPPQAVAEGFAGLDFLLFQEVEREIAEGRYHRGLSATVQLLARKPTA
jgi:SAM-dependent methyltransferase